MFINDATVYICRSANTWANDLALTVTYFPQSNLAFGILFGCTASIEKKVLNRLAETKEYGFHPLLLPGIFAELERERMVEVVESTIDRVEEAIFELDTGSSVTGSSRETSETGHPSGARYVRRTVWLNTTFLRTRLRIWKTQLHKMIEEIEQLSSDQSILAPGAYDKVFGYMEDQHAGQYNHSPVQRTDGLIRDRLRAIVEEFDEMIGDCSMRVDGMTIATQWVGRSRMSSCSLIATTYRGLIDICSLKAIRMSTSQRLLGEIPARCDPYPWSR